MGESFFKKKIRSWINNIIATSSYIKQDVLQRKQAERAFRFTADYSFGWKEVIETSVKEQKIKGLLLTGPDGCGKHTAAEIAIDVLANENYEILYLSGKDFIFSDADVKADEEERQNLIEKEDWDCLTDDVVHTFLDDLLNEFYNDERQDNLCLVLENVEQSNMMESVYVCLGKYMCMYDSNEDFPSLFIILIEHDDGCIPSMLRKYLRLIRMSLPNMLQRRQVLINCGIDAAVAEPIANSTENFNYSQIRDLAENIAVWSELDELTSDFYRNLVNAQSPVPVLSANEDIFVAEKVQLYKKIEDFIELVPQILEKMGQASYVSVPVNTAPASQPLTETMPINEIQSSEDFQQQKAQLERDFQDNKAKIERESENMTMNSLLVNVLGENKVNDIFGKRERN